MNSRLTHFLLAGGLVLLAIAAFLYWFIGVREGSPEHTLPEHTLTVAEGFQVELVAGPPLVERPIVADFDEQGRLYVAESSGSNEDVEKQLEEKPHHITRLEDTDGDGRFDRSIVFADRMMLPQGALWHEGSLYVGAPPSIWKLTDTDGDGVADQREEWFQGHTLTHCANDVHGPFLGLDGWMYWTKGAFAEQTYERPSKPPLVTRAAHIFRRRPGDSLIESVMTGGMANPVDVAFTPRGERLLATTFLHRPELGRRDGLIHAIYGGVYGMVNEVLDGHQRTGDLMPPLLHLGPAVPCALAIYRSQIFGREYQGNLFACLFNLHKVTRHVLEPSGETFKSRDTDFLVSSSRDFRPTDVIEDADGSLLVIDTGGWYKLCCPTSQLAKPDVPGAIYRIRRKGAPGVEDARGLRIDWTAGPSELAGLLGDPRPAVRSRAIQELAKRGSESVAVLARTLQTSDSVQVRRNALWALTRIEQAEARAAVRQALSDGDESVRQAAIHSVSVWRDTDSLPQLLDLLEQGRAPIQRAAAEALGRLGDSRAVPALLARAGVESDRILEHSLTYALIEISDPGSTAAGLRASSPYTRRAALIALDQMDGGGLKADKVTPLLASAEPVIKQTAFWIVGHHPEWGEEMAGFFRRRLASRNLSSDEQAQLEHQLSKFGRHLTIQSLLAATVREAGSKESRLTALRAMARTALKEIPDIWAEGFTSVLSGGDTALIQQAVFSLRALPAPGEEDVSNLSAALLRVGRDHTLPDEVRLKALAAVPGSLDGLDPELFDLLSASVKPSQTVASRTAAASALGRSKLTPDQLLRLTDSIRSGGPLELSTLLQAFQNASDEELGLQLIEAIRNSKGLFSLRADVMTQCLANFPRSVQEEGEKLLASLEMDPVKQKAHLEKLLASLGEGDIRHGQEVFNSTRAACSACHAIGYQGGKSGPDLTKIGEVRTRRDLLESIIFPSASFVQSYEPVLVVTESGDLHQGVITEAGHEEILLVTGPETKVRVARSEISEIRPSNVSVMPTGLEEQLSRKELASLLTFLANTRWGAL